MTNWLIKTFTEGNIWSSGWRWYADLSSDPGAIGTEKPLGVEIASERLVGSPSL